jgi:hypothetical protein
VASHDVVSSICEARSVGGKELASVLSGDYSRGGDTVDFGFDRTEALTGRRKKNEKKSKGGGFESMGRAYPRLLTAPPSTLSPSLPPPSILPPPSPLLPLYSFLLLPPLLSSI